MKNILIYTLCGVLVAAGSGLTSVAGANGNTAEATAEITYNYGGDNHSRRMEKLGRGLIAVKTGDGVYLSWRLSGEECSVKNIVNAPDFEIYKNGKKLCEVTDSTNYIDRSGTGADLYSVSVRDGERCDEVSVWNDRYTDIALDKPSDFEYNGTTYSYTVGDASCGDLDGDGEYEIVLKWNCNPQDNSNSGVTGNVYLDAYKTDGTRLWRIDLGRNIRSGEHYTQFLVYDFDFDGIAEVTCKTAPGSLDASGNYVSSVSNDASVRNVDNTAVYVNEGGYILSGEEFFTVFDGKTGNAVDTINYPIARVSATVWGDNYGNRCDRYLADVAYLDGEKPYAVYWRGYYGGKDNYPGRTGIFCASFDGERLSVNENHIFETRSDQPGYTAGNESVIGQGNHNITVADVDDDGKDEFISGALCFELKDTGKLGVKWNTGLGHGDALHIGDYDPTHEGLEYFTVHESSPYGSSVIDANTGEILAHWDGSKDTGRGTMVNVGAGGYYQTTDAKGNYYYAMGNGVFEKGLGIGWNFRTFWDGDLYDEILDEKRVGTTDSSTVSSWNGSEMELVFNAGDYGCVSINGTKSVPALQADLFGDWREELVYPTSDNKTLRIFTSAELTEYKLPTLMHDPVYRSGVAAEQTAYNQPPHIGFYLAEEIFKPEITEIKVTALPSKTEYFAGESLDTSGMEVTAYYNDGSEETVKGYIVSGYNKNSAGEQVITVTLGKQTAQFKILVKSGFILNEDGYISGYTLNSDEAVVPETIDGREVKGFADGALANSGLKRITILLSKLYIGENVFPEGIKIICYTGTDIYNYAIEHGLEVEISDTREYTLNLSYGESEYDGFYMIQTDADRTETIGHIQYKTVGRNGGGDGKSGFSVIELDGEKVLNVGVGRFGNSGRHARFTLQDIPKLSDDTDSVFETDIMFRENDERHAVMTVYDSSNEIVDTVSVSALSLENDVWYTYKLIYHNGAYYRALCKKGEAAEPVKIADNSSEYGATLFAFTKDESNSAAIGNGQSADVCLDNTKVYTNIEIVNLELRIVDEKGTAVAKPTVVINGKETKCGEDGVFSGTVLSGMYNITVSCDDYEERHMIVGAYESSVKKTITLSGICRIVSVNGNEAILSNPKDGYAVYAAKYGEDGTLESVSRQTVNSEQESYTVPSDVCKVFLWDDMMPIDLWIKGE